MAESDEHLRLVVTKGDHIAAGLCYFVGAGAIEILSKVANNRGLLLGSVVLGAVGLKHFFQSADAPSRMPQGEV